VIDEDLLAPATLLLVVRAPVNLEVEVLEHGIPCMLCPTSHEIVRSTYAHHLAGHRSA
jgi:hypothetical protein